MNDNWDSVRNVTEYERERFMMEQNASSVNISDEARGEHNMKLALLDIRSRTKEAENLIQEI